MSPKAFRPPIAHIPPLANRPALHTATSNTASQSAPTKSIPTESFPSSENMSPSIHATIIISGSVSVPARTMRLIRASLLLIDANGLDAFRMSSLTIMPVFVPTYRQFSRLADRAEIDIALERISDLIIGKVVAALDGERVSTRLTRPESPPQMILPSAAIQQSFNGAANKSPCFLSTYRHTPEDPAQSHTSTDPSEEADAKVLPVLSRKHVRVTRPLCPENVLRHSPFSTVHSFTSVSPAPVSATLPDGKKLHVVTSPTCPPLLSNVLES
mmetsp:Transcript_31778/g.51103  ORF Transcript_31778/g.51103 Transcript_31778/m.51103 type:complete len:271 (-) Transcript_31778:626-1438(-)